MGGIGPKGSGSTTGCPESADNQAMPRAGEATPDVAHYADGGVRYRGFQLDGQMHGAWEFLRRDGTVMRRGEFDLGKQVGIWKTFDRNGKVVKETDFSKKG
jgi:antitoxin component YwqK of YwqJK toxin-antitoxin module